MQICKLYQGVPGSPGQVGAIGPVGQPVST